jgi:hypothetical protein
MATEGLKKPKFKSSKSIDRWEHWKRPFFMGQSKGEVYGISG